MAKKVPSLLSSFLRSGETGSLRRAGQYFFVIAVFFSGAGLGGLLAKNMAADRERIILFSAASVVREFSVDVERREENLRKAESNGGRRNGKREEGIDGNDIVEKSTTVGSGEECAVSYGVILCGGIYENSD